MNKNILITILLIGSLSGCMTTQDNANKITEADTQENVNAETKSFSVGSVANEVFHLKTIDFAEPPVKINNVTFVFSNNELLGNVIKGNAGCNNYFTKYNTTRSSLITGQIATTTNRCKYDQMQLESFIFKIFSENPIIALKGNKLYLKGVKNNLMFEKKVKILTEEEIKLEKERKKDEAEFDKMK